MNSDEWTNRFEKAFDQVKPVDEAHAERIAKMRERFKGRAQETSLEIEKIQFEARERQERANASRQIADAAIQTTKELAEERRIEFGRQVEALERIVEVLEVRRKKA